MTISELKKVINEMIDPLSVKSVLTVQGDKPKNTAEMLITYPFPGYEGTGLLIGGEKFQWSFTNDGKDWLFNSDLIE